MSVASRQVDSVEANDPGPSDANSLRHLLRLAVTELGRERHKVNKAVSGNDYARLSLSCGSSGRNATRNRSSNLRTSTVEVGELPFYMWRMEQVLWWTLNMHFG